ncbi:hypothetical protein ACFSEO_09280 [Agromyces cerinus subsp. nitratus]
MGCSVRCGVRGEEGDRRVAGRVRAATAPRGIPSIDAALGQAASTPSRRA